MTEEIQKALEVLRAGGTLLCPTDTIWGISCDATNKEAVEKIIRIKQRNELKSMIVLVDDEKQLNKYVKEVPAIAWDLIEMAEKPLTIIYDGARGLASNVIAQDGSIAIRVVRDEFCKKLIHRLGKPVVSTSANISGKPAPHNFISIDEEILKAVDYVVHWRQDEPFTARPSSILRIKISGEIQVVRK